jgi:hypothetical protein
MAQFAKPALVHKKNCLYYAVHRYIHDTADSIFDSQTPLLTPLFPLTHVSPAHEGSVAVGPSRGVEGVHTGWVSVVGRHRQQSFHKTNLGKSNQKNKIPSLETNKLNMARRCLKSRNPLRPIFTDEKAA